MTSLVVGELVVVSSGGWRRLVTDDDDDVQLHTPVELPAS